MQPFPWFDLVIIVALVLVNGVFALSEMAIVSSNRTRLQTLAAQGRRGAARAVALAMDPGSFLSTVQIGITLVGILAGAYSGASLGGPVGDRLALLGLDPETADRAGFALVIVLTTYLSLIIGELVPKRLALRSPERLACCVAPPMSLLAQLAAPIVWLLDRSSTLVARLLGAHRQDQSQVTTEEFRMIVAEAESAGVIEESERQMITSVIRLGDRQVRAIMTPRTDIDWLDADLTPEETREALLASQHSRLPLAEGSIDEIIGVVHARDLLDALLLDRPLELRALARPAPVLPDVTTALDALPTLLASDVALALVHDEYGHFEGIVTTADLLAAITGAFRSTSDPGADPAVQRADGSWLLSGSLPADELADTLGIALPESRDYQTVAGFILSHLRHLPQTGERLVAHGWEFEVVDLDGRKIDKVIASRTADAAGTVRKTTADGPPAD